MSEALSYFDALEQVAQTIALGPDALPNALFAGSPEHNLRGLRVHANTISHARLVALEDTFPHTRQLIGDALFNTLSRSYFDDGHGRSQSLDMLGERFPHWLDSSGRSPLEIALARFEWLWLTSYHAADAEPLSAAPFVQADPAQVLAMSVKTHPAAGLMPTVTGLSELLGLSGSGDWLLLARPDADVTVQLVPASTAALFHTFLTGDTLGHAFETILTNDADGNPLEAMQFLIAAGVLAKDDRPC